MTFTVEMKKKAGYHTHAELCQLALKWLLRPRVYPRRIVSVRATVPTLELIGHDKIPLNASACGCVVAATELSTGAPEPDCIGFDTAGRSHYVEVKISRSDFLRDAKKWHRQVSKRNPEEGVGNYRWFFTGINVINDQDDLGGWGHVEVHGKKLTVKKYSRHFESKGIDVVSMMVRIMRVIQAKSGRSFFALKEWPMEVTELTSEESKVK